MSDAPVDPRWPKILSLSVHEFRTPISVVVGYLRMLLQERFGPLNDQQRGLLERIEKSCVRLTELVAEVSDLSALEGGSAPLKRQATDLHTALREAVARLPSLPEREVRVTLQLESDAAPLEGDPKRLTQALTSIIHSLQREMVSDAPLIVRQRIVGEEYEILIGDEETLAQLDVEAPATRQVFDEWRGGCGLILPVARRIIDAHGGGIWGSPHKGKPGVGQAGARIRLPHNGRSAGARPPS